MNLESQSLVRLAAKASVCTAILLIIIKLLAWLASGSVSLLASLVDSLMDSAASLLSLWAVSIAMTPADSKHGFGHGKAEPLAGMVQAAFIGGSAVFLLLNALERLQHPQPLQQVPLAMLVMAVSIGATLVLLWIQRQAVAQSGSLAIQADSLHYASDLLANAAVLLALFLEQFGWYWADATLALLIAPYVLYSAGQIGYESTQTLMDQALPEQEQQQIRDLAQHPQVVGLSDLRTRRAGSVRFIQFNIEVDGALSLWQAHDIAELIEQRIQQHWPEAWVMIHQEPVAMSDRA